MSCFLSSNTNRAIHFSRRRKVRRKKGEKEREGKGQTVLVRQNFEPVIKCMRRRWIRLSTLGHRSCFRIFTHPLSDSSSGCFVATYTRSAAVPLYTSSSVSLAPLHPFRATRRFPYPGYVWNRVDRGNSLAWKFPRAGAAAAAAASTGMLTRQSQPSISRSFDCQFHYHIVSSRTTSSIPLGIRRLSSLLRKKERVANKKRKSALSLFYLLNIVKIFVKIRFRDDISFARKEISQFCYPQVGNTFVYRETWPKRGV